MRGSTQNLRRRAPFLAVLCLVPLCVAPGDAQTLPCTKVFALDDDGSWHVDANWIPSGVPGPTDVACILEGDDFKVTVEHPVTVAGVEISGPDDNPRLIIAGTTFTLNGKGLVSGAATLKVETGGELRTDGGGVVEVRSKLKVEDSTIAVDVELHGELKVEGESFIGGTLTTYPGSVILIEGGPAGGSLTFANGFENNGELVLGDGGVQTITVLSGSLVNTAEGSIVVSPGAGPPGAIPELRAELVNHGLVVLDGLGLLIASDGSLHSNEAGGTIAVAGAELELDLASVLEAASNFTNYGSITVAGGGSIRVTGSASTLKAASNFTNYGSITVAQGGSIRVTGSQDDGTTISMVNAGSIDLASAASLELIGVGFEHLSTGELKGSGTLDVASATGAVLDGTLRPGSSPGIFHVIGDIGAGPKARVFIEIGGTAAGSGHDKVEISGGLTAAGLLGVALLPPYQPTGGERYEVASYASLAGAFDAFDLPPLQHALGWEVDPAPQVLALNVVCLGTQLAAELAADRDPVSLGHDLVYLATVRNLSAVPATDLVLTLPIPAELLFRPDLSSAECVPVGDVVECGLAGLAPSGVWQLAIGAEPVLAGAVAATGTVSAWECDTEPTDNQATVLVQVVAAEPCDANYDLSVDSDDLVPAVGHIFGDPASGNPDCRLAGGITADDLAAIIDAAQ